MRCKQWIRIFGGTALGLSALACQPAKKETRVSRHLEYSGYTQPEYHSFKKESHYLTTRDGERIAVDTFEPAEPVEEPAGGAADSGRFPTLLMLTPYGRSLIMEDLSLLEKMGAFFKYGTGGPVFDATTRADVRLLLAHGYAVVSASMRGTGASTGRQLPFDPALADDAEDTIAWSREREWANGELCMLGRSYRAWIQLMVAARKPAGLRCIMPEVILFDSYTEGLRPGGIDAIGWIESYSELLTGLNRGDLDRVNQMIAPTPVIDEDGAGELLDALPLRRDPALGSGGPRSFFEDAAPRYADGQPREDVYFNAIREHADNLPFRFFRRENTPYRDSRSDEAPGLSFAQASPGYYLPELAQSDVAVYHIGGWFDGFVPGTSKLYASMAAAGQRQMKLQIAPRFHMNPYVPPAYAKHMRRTADYAGDYTEQLARERLRFFDHHLKGVDNGIHDEAPANI